MLAQKIESVNSSKVNYTISYVLANAVARKISNYSLNKPIKILKIGITSKGQPWMVYSINGKKCCQFISKKLWEEAEKKLYLFYTVSFVNQSLEFKFEVFNLKSRHHYFGVFTTNLNKSLSLCSCDGFYYRHTCSHTQVMEEIGLRIAKLYFVDKSVSIVDNCIVANQSSSIKQVDSHIESFASFLWKQRVSPTVFDGKKIRISYCEAEQIANELNSSSDYYIDDADNGLFLVLKESQQKAIPSTVNNTDEFPDIFADVFDEDFIDLIEDFKWFKDPNNEWKSFWE